MRIDSVKPMANVHRCLLIVLIGALAIRAFSFQWNSFPHADVNGDAETAYAFREYGCLLAVGYRTLPDPITCPESQEENRSRIQSVRPPGWPLMGAAVMTFLREPPSPETAFLAFRILSFLCGLAILLLSYRIGSILLGGWYGLLAASVLGASYIMSDFSGNGSLYAVQAVLYLAWILTALRPDSSARAALMGAIAGVTYAFTYQGVILIAATVLLYAFTPRMPWRRKVRCALLSCIVAAIFMSPVLLRSTVVFGDPLFGHKVTGSYAYRKAGLSEYLDGDLVSSRVDLYARIEMARSILFHWLPLNLYYVARKLMILAPLSFFLFAFALIDYLFERERRERMMPVLLLLALHLFITAGWPIVKFRFFVPMLPLIILVAADELHALPIATTWKKRTGVTLFLCTIAVSFLAFRSIPTHTHYYDGALTEDPFSGSEEIKYLEAEGRIPKP